MLRIEFLKMSVAALAGLSVLDLTDGHDEFLWDREHSGKSGAATIRVLGDNGEAVTERTVSCTVVDGEYYAPEIENLVVRCTDRPQGISDVTVTVRVDGFDPEFTSSMAPSTFRHTRLYPGETFEVEFPQPIVRVTWA